MDTVSIAVRPRYTSGSAVAKKIRRAGLVPAVLYSQGTAAQMVAFDPKPVTRALNGPYGRNQLFEIAITGTTETCLAIARELQLGAVSRKLTHVDFLRVEPNSPISVTIPIVPTGRSAGEKVGGRVNFIRREVVIACTPATLPKNVTINMGPLQVGEEFAVEQLAFPAGVTPVYRKAFKILEVLAPKAAEVTEEGAAAAEPGAAKAKAPKAPKAK